MSMRPGSKFNGCCREVTRPNFVILGMQGDKKRRPTGLHKHLPLRAGGVPTSGLEGGGFSRKYEHARRRDLVAQLQAAVLLGRRPPPRQRQPRLLAVLGRPALHHGAPSYQPLNIKPLSKPHKPPLRLLMVRGPRAQIGMHRLGMPGSNHTGAADPGNETTP